MAATLKADVTCAHQEKNINQASFSSKARQQKLALVQPEQEERP